jgi:hypothetical protein
MRRLRRYEGIGLLKINAEIGGKEELIAKSMRKKEAIRDRIQISERYLEVLEEIDRNVRV